MYKSKDQTNGIDWAVIFERRPDLSPPGYSETVKTIQALKKEKTNGQND